MFTGFDVGHEAQQIGQIISFWKALAGHQAFTFQFRVGQ